MSSTADHPPPPKVPRRLYSPRLLLRPFRLADAASLHEAANEDIAELTRRFPNAHRDLATIADTRRHLVRCHANWRSGRRLEYGIITRSDDRLLGAVALKPDWQALRFALTFWLRPTARGRGYATEAASTLTAFSMERLGARAIEMRIDADHDPSRRIAQRLGFTSCGTGQDAGLSWGTADGTLVVSRLTAEMWSARLDASRSAERDGAQ